MYQNTRHNRWCKQLSMKYYKRNKKTKQGYEQEDVSVSVALSRGDNAFRTSKVLDTILSSYYGGREIGYWDRSNTWPGRLNSSSP